MVIVIDPERVVKKSLEKLSSGDYNEFDEIVLYLIPPHYVSRERVIPSLKECFKKIVENPNEYFPYIVREAEEGLNSIEKGTRIYFRGHTL